MNFNINITQGTTFSQQIVVTGRDFTTALNGYCQIRKLANQDSPVVAEPVVTFPALPLGAIQIDLTAQETQAIPVTSRALTAADTFQFDIKVENEGGIITQEVSGNAFVSPSVTFIS